MMESSPNLDTSSSSSLSSLTTLNRYEQNIEEDLNIDCKNTLITQNKSQSQYSQPPSPTRITIYPTPHNPVEMRHLIARAERESDPRILAIYDSALAPYCSNINNLKNLLHDEVRFRFFCLNFPQSKTQFVGLLNSAIEKGHGKKLVITHFIQDDQDSALSALL